jgi:hypothetical protein
MIIELAVGVGLLAWCGRAASSGDKAIRKAGRSAAQLADDAVDAANRATMPCAFGLASHKPAVTHDETGAVPYCRVCRGSL